MEPDQGCVTAGTGSPVVLGRAGLRVGAALLGVQLLVVLVCLHLGLGAAGYPLGIMLATLCLLVVNYGNTVRLDDDALVVRRRGRVRRYLWSDVLEVSWRDDPVYGVGGPVVRTRGGPYDQPGPNMPGLVAPLPVFGRAQRRQAVGALREAALQHGVPYSDDMEREIALGHRRPRLPSDAA